MVGVAEHVQRRSLWKTAVVLLALVLLASPSAPVPIQFLYALSFVVALLLPIRRVNRTVVLRFVGVSSFAVGTWLFVGYDVVRWQTLGFFVLGILALFLPELVPDDADS